MIRAAVRMDALPSFSVLLLRLGRPPVKPESERAIRLQQAKGMGILKIARELGIGASVGQRTVSAGAAA